MARAWVRRMALASMAAIACLAWARLVPAHPTGKRVEIAIVLGSGAAVVTAEVADPVYKKPKRYEGHDLAGLVRKAWPDADRWATQGAELVFHCADGFAPSIDLARALAGAGVVATRDLDQPAGQAWEPFPHGKETITPAPYYLVWRGVDPADGSYKWPYQLVAISIETFDRRYGNAAPGDGASDDARRGFRLFVQNCAACHSINLVGGDLGPELNVPRNVTEYWPSEHLANFIKAPETYRLRSKMPDFLHLAEAERSSIIAYLIAMRGHKICPAGSAC